MAMQLGKLSLKSVTQLAKNIGHKYGLTWDTVYHLEEGRGDLKGIIFLGERNTFSEQYEIGNTKYSDTSANEDNSFRNHIR